MGIRPNVGRGGGVAAPTLGRRLAIVSAVAALLAGGGVFRVSRAAEIDPRARADRALCGRNDLPETGIEGDVPMADQISGRAALGYNCGIALVGHVDLAGGSSNQAWVGSCAYVAQVTTGTARGDDRSLDALTQVVDVSDPTHPRLAGYLHGPGSSSTTETLAAVQAAGRSVLVAGHYSGNVVEVHSPDGSFRSGSGTQPVDIYDVSDCVHPVLMSTIQLPIGVHNLTLSADGRRMFSTMPLQVTDISDLRHPVYLGNLQDQLPKKGNVDDGRGIFEDQVAHLAAVSPDGKRLYVGSQTKAINDERFWIIDIDGWPQAPPKVVGESTGAGHGVSLARIGGRPYVLHSNEDFVDPTAKGCAPPDLNPVASAAIAELTDISDETAPKTVSELRLAINRPENCAIQSASGVNASTHYHDVDDPNDTTFAMVSSWNAGVRIWDVRNPKAPRAVAYFNTGSWGALYDQPAAHVTNGLFANSLDRAWARVRYVARTGQIWMPTAVGGYWVLELEPQVRAALGLPRVRVLHPDGSAPRPPGVTSTAAPATSTDAIVYCTLSWQTTAARMSAGRLASSPAVPGR